MLGTVGPCVDVDNHSNTFWAPSWKLEGTQKTDQPTQRRSTRCRPEAF